MSETLQVALNTLRDLAGADEMQSPADEGPAPAARPKMNMHIHLPPNFSAFETVAQAVELADEQDVRVLCANNYYDYGVYGEFFALARAKGIFPIFGTEIIALLDDLVAAGVKINDPGNPGKMYICGKAITRLAPLSETAEQLLGTIRHNDSTRMAAMVEKLAAVFAERGLDTGLDAEMVIDMVVRRHGCPREMVVLQERHVAQAFQEVFFEKIPPPRRAEVLGGILAADYTGDADDFVNVQGEIRIHLMKAGKVAFVPETFGDFDQAYRLILELGGVPCYPTLADGTDPICQYEQPAEKLVENIKSRGIYCAEFIPTRNQPDVLSRYVRAMRQEGVVVCSGTEHNTLSLIGMEPTCRNDRPIGDDLKDIFWEGACVLAAHQHLVLNSRCGFVDSAGRLNPDYATDEDRIAAMAKLGAAVIQKYYRSNISLQGAHCQ